MQPWIYALASVIVVSLLSLIGVFSLVLKKNTLDQITFSLVSFAIGGLLGDAFIHLLPEAYEKFGSGLKPALLVLSGILLFFVLEKFLRWRHCHVQTSKVHVHPVVTMNLVGDAVHNLIDGMIIGASYLVSLPVGLTTTLAVVLHEIPQEIGDFGILIHGKLSISKALSFNFLTALTAVLGAVLSLLLGKYLAGYAALLVPVTAGGFIYIAASDLIPELHHNCERMSVSFWQFVWIVLGVAIMAALVLLE